MPSIPPSRPRPSIKRAWKLPSNKRAWKLPRTKRAWRRPSTKRAWTRPCTKKAAIPSFLCKMGLFLQVHLFRFVTHELVRVLGGSPDKHAPYGVKQVPDADKHVPDGDKHVPDPDKQVGDKRVPYGVKHVPDGDKHAPDGDKHVPDADKRVPYGDKHVPDRDKYEVKHVPDGEKHAPYGVKHIPDGHKHLMTESTIDAVSGTYAGIASIIGCHPFDTVKCRIQSQGSGDIPVRYRNGWHCFIDILQTEGVRGLYKGVLPPIMMQGVMNGIVFGVEGPTRRLLHPRIKGDGVMKEIKVGCLAGMAGGFVQSFVCAPTELVKLRTQHQAMGKASSYRGNWATLKSIYYSKGITGCFQGLWITVFREVPAFGTYFASYHGQMHYFASRKGISKDELSKNLLYPFVCGGTTGIITWSVNYPVDLVKTRIQLDGADGAVRQYRNSWDCFAKAWREGGVRLLYRGLVPCCVRAFANSSCLFVAYELSMGFFHSFAGSK